MGSGQQLPLVYSRDKEGDYLQALNERTNHEYQYDIAKRNAYAKWNADPKDGAACGDYVAAKMRQMKDAGFDMKRVQPAEGRLMNDDGTYVDNHAILLVDGKTVLDVRKDKVYPLNPDNWEWLRNAATGDHLKQSDMQAVHDAQKELGRG